MDTKEALKRLYRIKKNELRMMIKQGYIFEQTYTIPSDHSFQQINVSWMLNPAATFEYFLQYRETYQKFINREDFSMLYIHPTTGEYTAVLYLPSAPGTKVNADTYKRHVGSLIILKIRKFVLISTHGVSADSKSYQESRTADREFIEYLDIQLNMDPTEHCLAPINNIYIPPGHVHAWSTEEGISANNLPLIHTSDPQAKWLRAQNGGVFMETILGSHEELITAYRTVRPAPKLKTGK